MSFSHQLRLRTSTYSREWMSAMCSAAAQPGIVGGTFRVKRDRHRRSCPPLDLRYAPLATKLARHCNRSRRAVTGCEQSQQGGPYSITSSARASSVGGTSRPSAFKPAASVAQTCGRTSTGRRVAHEAPWDGPPRARAAASRASAPRAPSLVGQFGQSRVGQAGREK